MNQLKKLFNKESKYILLIDQAFISIINFGSILVIAKLASIVVFSSFVVVYSYLYFTYIFLTLLLSNPILVFLKKKWNNNEENYLIVIILLNIVFNLILSSILYAFLSYQIEGVSYVSFLFVSLSMTLFEILKKYIFSSNNVNVFYAMLSSILLNLLFFGFLLLFKNELNLNAILKVYWFSFSFVVLGLLSFFYFKKTFNTNYKNISFTFIIDVAKTHINYSKWLILGGIAFWGYSQGIYIIAKSFDINDLVIGKVRTIQNLLGIFNILAFTIENYYTPIFSSKVKKNLILEVIPSLKGFYRENALRIFMLFAAGLPIGLYFYNIMYSEKFGNGLVIFLIFYLIQLALIIIKPIAIALKVIEVTKPFFVSHIFAVLSLLIFAPILLNKNNAIAFSLIFVIANIIYFYIIAYSFYLNYKK
jgi:O-antigen/teichoic acid export membrane protein